MMENKFLYQIKLQYKKEFAMRIEKIKIIITLATFFIISCTKEQSNEITNNKEWKITEKINAYSFNSPIKVVEPYRSSISEQLVQEINQDCPDIKIENLNELNHGTRLIFSIVTTELINSKRCNDGCPSGCAEGLPDLNESIFYVRFPLFEDKWYKIMPSKEEVDPLGNNEIYNYISNDMFFNVGSTYYGREIIFHINPYSCPNKTLSINNDFPLLFTKIDIVLENSKNDKLFIHPTITLQENNIIGNSDEYWQLTTSKNRIGISVNMLNACKGDLQSVSR
jgi:hypothetical protein